MTKDTLHLDTLPDDVLADRLTCLMRLITADTHPDATITTSIVSPPFPTNVPIASVAGTDNDLVVTLTLISGARCEITIALGGEEWRSHGRIVPQVAAAAEWLAARRTMPHPMDVIEEIAPSSQAVMDGDSAAVTIVATDRVTVLRPKAPHGRWVALVEGWPSDEIITDTPNMLVERTRALLDERASQRTDQSPILTAADRVIHASRLHPATGTPIVVERDGTSVFARTTMSGRTEVSISLPGGHVTIAAPLHAPTIIWHAMRHLTDDGQWHDGGMLRDSGVPTATITVASGGTTITMTAAPGQWPVERATRVLMALTGAVDGGAVL